MDQRYFEDPPPKKKTIKDQNSLLPFLSVAHQNLMVISYCWRDHRAWRNQIATDQGAFSWLDNFHSTRRRIQAAGGNGITSITQLWAGQTAIMTSVARYSHGYSDSTSNCLPDGFKAQSVSATVNRVSSLRLRSSQAPGWSYYWHSAQWTQYQIVLLSL